MPKEFIEVDGLQFTLRDWELKRPREEVIEDKRESIGKIDRDLLVALRAVQAQFQQIALEFWSDPTFDYEGRELRFRYTNDKKEWPDRHYYGEKPPPFQKTHLLAEDTKKSDKHSTVFFASVEEVNPKDIVAAVGKWVKDVDKRVARGKKAKARRKDKKIEDAHPGYYVSLALEEELKARGYEITTRGEYVYGDKGGLHTRMWVRGWDDHPKQKNVGTLGFGTLHHFGGNIGSQWVDMQKTIEKRPEDPTWNPQMMAQDIVDTLESHLHHIAELSKVGWKES